MSYEPNEQQRLAIDEFDSDILVSAGAGTGKTSVLSGKYLKLLEERRAEVDRIVAITFTKKAAAEMCDRIGKAILEKVETAEALEERAFWRTQFNKLEKARICTFHSFCLGLIREYPVEAGIPPVTAVLDEGEESLMLRQAVTAALVETMQDDSGDTLRFHQMLMEYGWDSWINSLASLYRAVRESGVTFATVVKSSLNSLKQAIDSQPLSIESLIETIQEFLEYSKTQKLTDRAKELLFIFGNDWPEHCKVLQRGFSWTRQIALLCEIKKALPRNLPACLKERVTEIHEMADALSAKLVDNEAVYRIPILGELLERIHRNFRDAKLESGSLDFTDQQLLARDLLRQNPKIASKIEQGIAYLLVDEFQDTNEMQLEIIDFLVGKEHRGGRLMTVGDIKQSIYRFRGAEAGVILAMAKRIQNQGGQVIPLTYNYRSNPMIIRFVNQLSRSLFAGEAFRYEALEAKRQDQGSAIEFIISGEGGLEEQASMVACRIAKLVRESRNCEFPIHYQDIAILFRAGTAMPIFQKALLAQGIPNYTAGGSDFFRRPEVVDQLNLLRLVHQRYDTVALLGVLSSPYVGLTEESLFWLRDPRSFDEHFYEAESWNEQISLPEQERLSIFREVILYLQENRDLLEIPEMLEIALDKLGYRELLRTLPDASQRLANLEKLLVKADEFVTRGYHNLTSFLTYIEDLETMEIMENEAQTQAETSQVVRLMTIHRSKGLEFPVVILPDLDRSFTLTSRERLVYHKDVGIGFKIPLESGGSAETSLGKNIKDRERSEEIAELKRILYVALTRAKRHLILAGSEAGPPKGDTLETAQNWMKWLEILVPSFENASEIDFGGIPIQIIRKLDPETKPEQRSNLLERYMEHLGAPAMESNDEVAAAMQSAPVSINLKVSGILAFKKCPRRFYLEQGLRLPQPATWESPSATGSASDALGVQIGIFLHQAMRMHDLELDTTGWPESLWQQYFATLSETEAHSLKTALQRMWRHFRESEFCRPGDTFWDEVPFLLKLGPDARIEGRFDRLIRRKDGSLVLVDYKTHRIGKEKTGEVAPTYFWQLQLYSLAVEALWGRKPDRAVLYFLYSDTIVPVPLEEAELDSTVREVQKISGFVATHHCITDFPMSEVCASCSYGWFCRKSESSRWDANAL